MTRERRDERRMRKSIGGKGDIMGIYLNPGNGSFKIAVNTEPYVDKSSLIAFTNKLILTEKRFACVSRPRRFGKSMAANMISAYYSKGCDSREMFDKFKISSDSSFSFTLFSFSL